MKTLTVKEKMLYCPKCKETYSDGSQRFCNNDGGRLIPAPDSPKSSGQSGGVFSSLLGKTEPQINNDEKLASLPRFTRSEQSNLPVYEVSVGNRKVQPEPEPEIEIELELELLDPQPSKPVTPVFLAPESPPVQPPKTEIDEFPLEITEQEIPQILQTSFEIPKPKFSVPFSKPPARTIDPSEIPSGTAEIGNRQTNPTGRNALTWENPQVLVGASVKGRYHVLEQIEADESSISYLANDNLVPNKKVIVRVLMNEESGDEFIKTIYAEERISLAHVNHPNIVRVIDSGELLEGKQFIVTEFIEADSVGKVLKTSEKFNALRTARIVRQIAYALSEAHQNGILHRNIKPENLLLDVSEAGTEQVKLTHFGVWDAKGGDVTYKSPEILEGRLATFSSDIYSLAIVAFQMLTGRLPFASNNSKELLKEQYGGLKINPSDLRLDLPAEVDSVLEKALNYPPTERYPKARDFGDAFFNALNVFAPWDETASEEAIVETFPARPKKELTILPIGDTGKTANLESTDRILDLGRIDSEKSEPIVETKTEEPVFPIIGDIHITPREEKEEIAPAATVAATETKETDPAWTRRSPEPPPTNSRNWWMISFFGLAILLLGLWAIWTYFLNRPAQIEVGNNPQTNVQTQPTIQTTVPGSVLSASDIEETPPLQRQIAQPADSSFFENSKQTAKGDLLRNFLGFSLYYPNNWKINESAPSEKAGTRGKFLDISRKSENGTPIEQMLISYYDSKGTYKADAGNFPRLVKEANETLKKILPNYNVLSEGEIKINGGWRAYEIKFQGGDKTANGEQLNLWGRRLYIPTGRSGIRSGYEITMFATSLSTEVKSVDDVGVKGELGKILETFEPNQNF